MSRRNTAEKRTIAPDYKFSDLVVAKLINMVMKDGHKTIAQSIVYSALEILKRQHKQLDALKLFNEALENVKPHLEVRSKRIGGATYQIPVEVNQNRGQTLGLRWLINAARARSEKTMGNRLAAELNDAIQKRGAAHKKKEDTGKMAEANRAFAHYRF